MGRLQVVRATGKDIDKITPLFDAYRQFYNQRSDLEGARGFLEQRLGKDESVIFLALENGRVVGFVQLYPSFSSVSMRRLWILNDLFVAQEARRSGAATALLEKSRELAEKTDAEALILETGEDNDAAQQLYRKLGWKRNQTFNQYSLVI